MDVIGKTSDGKPVVTGVYKLYSTHGLPLDVLFIGILSRSYMVCWLTLYRDGIRAGIKPNKWVTMIESALHDAGQSDLAKHVGAVLRQLGDLQ